MATRKQIINKIIEAKNWGHYWAIKSLYTPNLATKNNTLDLDNKRHYLLVPTPDEIQKIAQSKGWTNIPDELDKIIINCKSEDLVELPIRGTTPGVTYTFKKFLGLFNGKTERKANITTYKKLKSIDKKFYTKDANYHELLGLSCHLIPESKLDEVIQDLAEPNGNKKNVYTKLKNESLWENIKLPKKIKTCRLSSKQIDGTMDIRKHFKEREYE